MSLAVRKVFVVDLQSECRLDHKFRNRNSAFHGHFWVCSRLRNEANAETTRRDNCDHSHTRALKVPNNVGILLYRFSPQLRRRFRFQWDQIYNWHLVDDNEHDCPSPIRFSSFHSQTNLLVPRFSLHVTYLRMQSVTFVIIRIFGSSRSAIFARSLPRQGKTTPTWYVSYFILGPLLGPSL